MVKQMSPLQRLESAFALEEFEPLRTKIITPCSFGMNWSEFAHNGQVDGDWTMFHTCPYRAAFTGCDGYNPEHTNSFGWPANRPICITHAIHVAQAQETAVGFTCATSLGESACCVQRVSAVSPCPQHGEPPSLPVELTS